MWSLLFPSVHDRKLIPEGRLSGPMPWVIAIMVFLTVLAAATGLSVRSGARSVNADLAGRVTVQIVEANPDERARQADAALTMLRSDPKIAKVVRVPDAEVQAILAPWIGGDSLNTDIPVPALIDVDLVEAANVATLSELRATLENAAPGARVDANASWLGPVFDLLVTLQWLALGLVTLLAIATAAAVVLSARSALNSHGEAIKIIHLLGGTDKQVARLFQRRIALDALFGGVFGLILGVAVILVFAGQAGRLGSDLVRSASLGPVDWIILIFIPLLAMLLALFTARLTIMRALGKAL